ncbi:hypothetical protein HX109_14330 [Galbibacter sp. BG1]|uniref:hypothetical protein n=1 Tax=Galbibacter sp. BG1 TaxID=1170699 RepID=UPI0015BC4C6A|nr:hypothetical protein [Galbibacter sp. BG1]QLE02678.1 hypothetical protein HX109_14330 [Galbibacter sp. BG1]
MVYFLKNFSLLLLIVSTEAFSQFSGTYFVDENTSTDNNIMILDGDYKRFVFLEDRTFIIKDGTFNEYGTYKISSDTLKLSFKHQPKQFYILEFIRNLNNPDVAKLFIEARDYNTNEIISDTKVTIQNEHQSLVTFNLNSHSNNEIFITRNDEFKSINIFSRLYESIQLPIDTLMGKEIKIIAKLRYGEIAAPAEDTEIIYTFKKNKKNRYSLKNVKGDTIFLFKP